MFIKNFKISGAIGAAPDTALSTFKRPNFFFSALKQITCATKFVAFASRSPSPYSSLLFAEKFPNFDAVANSNFFSLDASFILTRVPACIRSRILGTAGNIEG